MARAAAAAAQQSLPCFAPRSISSPRCRRSRPAADYARHRLDRVGLLRQSPSRAVTPTDSSASWWRLQTIAVARLIRRLHACKIDFFGFFYSLIEYQLFDGMLLRQSPHMSETSGDPHMANG
ncbi:hypothetical protein EJB05_57913, partial [Eragrostis curvula]